jgi:hypothetical protein
MLYTILYCMKLQMYSDRCSSTGELRQQLVHAESSSQTLCFLHFQLCVLWCTNQQ